MQLVPFARVDAVSFASSREDIERQWGRPPVEGFNLVGLTELDYGRVVFRFQSCGRVGFEVLEAYVRERDDGIFERAGFIVSPRFGLAFDPRSRYWLTALAAHCLDVGRAL